MVKAVTNDTWDVVVGSKWWFPKHIHTPKPYLQKRSCGDIERFQKEIILDIPDNP